MKRTTLLVLVIGAGLLISGASASIGAESTEEPLDEPMIPVEESMVTAEESAEPFTSLDNPLLQEDFNEVEYEEFSDELEELASVSVIESLNDETELPEENREAAEEGALEGIELAQEQGINVTQAQEQAAIDSAVRSATETEDAPPEKIKAATKGATHGAIIQSQQVNITQIQAGIYGSSAGSLSQFQNASVTQLQSASYGAAHGTVSQHQRVNVTQIQYAAVGAAAGATHSAVQTQQVNVTQIQEAAQGSGYGSLVQVQEVTVTQIQASAFGAAGGGADTGDSPKKDPKKVQEATMGAAQGALVQVQGVSVTQIQAAARGASKGALSQYQHASVTQIQQASKGAAKGAISQHQVATVRQIQAAATGSARGTLIQVQRVDIVQIQYAAAGAARGAAKSAAQHQVVDVQMIQAAAAGAGQGSVIQIQQVNIRQVQVIAEGAASGALSQYQHASVVQIQQAARGASDGALSITQIQVVTITQIQIISERTAAETARTAADTDIDHDEKIYKHAKGDAEDPGRDDDPDLKSLFFDVEDETLFLANPNDVTVTVTATSDGTVETITLSPGEMLTRQLEPGSYTLTAESADGRTVKLAGRESIRIAISEEPESLTATVDDQILRLTNPNDQHATVTVRDEQGGHVLTVDVSPTGDRTYPLDPGTYTLTAVLSDDRPVQINDDDETTVTVVPEELHLGVTVEDQSVTIQNPSETDVTVTATHDEIGDDQEIPVAAGETESQTLEPGPYTLTGEAEEDRLVLLNGEAELSITLTEAPPDAVDLSATVDNQTLSLDNPAETNVTVTATDETDEQQTFEVAAGGNTTEELEAGTYTLTGEAADDRPVTLNGEAELSITLTEAPPDAVDLSATVDNQTLSLENPAETDVTVTATDETDEQQTFEVAAGGNTTEELQAGTYTLTGEAADDRPVTLNGETELSITIEEPFVDMQIDSCRVIDEPGEYELTSDLVPEEDGNCLEITVGDVTIDGNDHQIDGSNIPGQPESSGIEVSRADDDATDILDEGDAITDVHIHDVQVTGWDDGLHVDELESTAIEDARIWDNQRGMFIADEGTATVTSVTLEGNEEIGLYATRLGDVTITDSAIQENAHGMTTHEDSVLEMNSSVVQNNDGDGIIVPETEASITDTTITGNGGVGLGHWMTFTLELDNVTVSENSGWELGPTTVLGAPSSTFAVTDLYVGETATLSFDFSATLALDVDDQETLPDPENARAVGDGLNATNLDGTADLRLEFETGEVDEDESVELWRYDGTEWLPVEDATVTEDALEASINESGLYAPVVSEELPDVELDVTVDEQTVTIENPAATQVTVTATADPIGELVQTIQVPSEGTVSEEFAAGSYTLTGEAEDDRQVTLNGEEELGISIEAQDINLDVTVEEDAVTVTNPSESAVTVTATNDETDQEQVIDVPADGTVTESLEAGSYTLTGETDDDRQVTLNGDAQFSFAIEGLQEGDLDVTVSEETVTITNPTDVAITVTATNDETGEEQVIDVPANGTVTETLEAGTYTLTGQAADDRPVTLNGETAFTVTIEGDQEIDLEYSVEEDAVTITNPSGTAVTVTATNDETGEEQIIDVPASGAVTETLEPGSYMLTGEADGQDVLLNGQQSVSLTVDAPDNESELNRI